MRSHLKCALMVRLGVAAFLLCIVDYSLVYAEDVPAGVARHRENAARFVSENRADLAVGEHRQVVSDYHSSKYAVESQGEIVRLKIRGGDKAGALSEYQKLLTDFSSSENLPMEIYSVAQEFKDSSASSQAMALHRYNVSHGQISVGSMKSQGAIVANAFENKDYQTAESELVKLKEVYGKTSGVAKEIHDLAQRYKAAGRGEDAIRWHKYNVNKYSDTFDGSVSQLEIVNAAFDSKDYATADQEVKFLTDNFGNRAGMSYGIYTVGKRFKEAGMPDKALAIHKLNAANASDMAGMLSQGEIIQDAFDKKDFDRVEKETEYMMGRFKEVTELPQEIYNVGIKFKSAGKSDKALQYHRLNVKNNPGTPKAMWSQVEVIIDSFDKKDFTSVEKELGQLKTIFADTNELNKEIFQIADRFRSVGRRKEAIANYRYNIEKFPDSWWASVSQLAIVDDEFAHKEYDSVSGEVDFLVSKYGSRGELAHGIYEIGNKYMESGFETKALEMYRVAAASSTGFSSMWAQVAIINECLERNDFQEASVQEKILCEKFKDTDGISKELYQLGSKYELLGMSDKAQAFHQLNAKNKSDSLNKIRSEIELAKSSTNSSGLQEAALRCSKLFNKYTGEDLLFHDAINLGLCFENSGDTASGKALLTEVKGILEEKVKSLHMKNRIQALTDLAIVNLHLGDHGKVFEIADGLLKDYGGQNDGTIAGDKSDFYVFVIAEQCYLVVSSLDSEGGSSNLDLNKRAVDYFVKVLALGNLAEDRVYEAQHMAAECYVGMGQYSQAAELFEKQIASGFSASNRWNTYYLLAECYEQMYRSGNMEKEKCREKTLDLYGIILKEYPDCPVSRVVSKKIKEYN